MNAPRPQRLDSVDALRGLTVAAMIFVNDPGDWSHLWWPFEHAEWHGCTPTDLVFPTFLFIVGVALALAGGPKLDAGSDLAPLQRAWWGRALRILLLGWALAALIAFSFGHHWRPFGVLQRIAVCFGLVGWLYLHVSPRVRWGLLAVLLVGYGLLLSSGADLGRDTSLPSRVDATLLGPFAYRYDAATGLGYEPEGLLSTLGALATTLFGAACGDWLRRRERRPIVLAGLVATLAGVALHAVWQPMNKALWTPALVLFTGGLAGASSILAAGAEVTGRPRLARSAKIGALAAITTSAAALVHDLGRPSRFYNMLRVAKPTSPMSMGSWLLAAYGPLAGATAACDVTGILPGAGRATGFGAAVLGSGVASYTAVLLADTAVPTWHESRAQLPFVFVGSAASAAAGLGLLAAPCSEAGPARRAALGGAALELAASNAMERAAGLAGETLHDGKAGILLRTAKALTAGGALAGATLGRRNRALAAVSGTALLIGSALTRFGIFEAGRASTLDPKYTVVPQRARLQERDQAGPHPIAQRT